MYVRVGNSWPLYMLPDGSYDLSIICKKSNPSELFDDSVAHTNESKVCTFLRTR